MTRYRTIVADPPWSVKAGPGPGGYHVVDGKQQWDGISRPARDLAYPSMRIDQITALPVRDLADDDAHLYLWTINRYLEDAYGIARAWGFKPSTMLVWAKTPFGGGLGGTYGLATEYVLFARRGSLAATQRVGRNWWDWKRAYDENGKPAHSRKPEAFLDMVEATSPGPYLELFARRNRLGWDTWGNQSFEHVEVSG
jgi:N6-adenosine-specific RNA methylase IME4